MSIQLSDAIERAKLATDESGMLAPYTYNQLIDALPEEEKYPFTVALVELGIQTKWAAYSIRDRESLSQFMEGEPEPVEESKEDSVERFAARLAKAAQQFVQSPGGLWTPESWQEEEETPLDDEDLEEVTPDDFYEEVQNEDILEEFPDYSSPAYVGDIREILEEEGISVDKDGNVSFYQSVLPGIYTEQIPMKPMPLDLAYKRYYQSFSIAQKEQGRVKGILDAVSRMTPEMEDLLDTTDYLANVKFSPQSRDKLVQSIATNLGDLNQILTDPDWYKIQPVLDNLKTSLETYVQQFSAQEERAYAVLDALDRLKDLQENDPERFQEATGGYGALAAFRKLHQVQEPTDYQIEKQWEFYEGDLPYIEVDIGRGYIRYRVQEENPALRGEVLEEEVADWEEFFKDNFVRDVLNNPYYMRYCESVEVNITEGDSYEVVAEFFENIPGENYQSYDIEEEISRDIEGSFEGVYE
jgi:hypothetical protein